jgi:LiaI-LiaF-like transmembrane region
MRRWSTFWGVALVVLGVLFLLESLGLLTVNIWNVLWPAILILFGLWILLGAFYRPQTRTERASIPLEGAQRAKVRVHHGAGHLTVNSNASADRIVDGTFAGGLDLRKQLVGDTLDVDLRVPTETFPAFWGPWNWHHGALDWTFGMSSAPTLQLEFETGASESRLDLSALHVADLWLKTGASSTDVMLPANAGSTRVRIEAGAASVALRVPDGVAARVRATGLIGVDVDTRRFPRAGDAYESPDYATAANKVDIDAQMGAGSIKVR